MLYISVVIRHIKAKGNGSLFSNMPSLSDPAVPSSSLDGMYGSGRPGLWHKNVLSGLQSKITQTRPSMKVQTMHVKILVSYIFDNDDF